MARKPTIPHAELAALLDWLERADTADSYEGFTFTKWVNSRPKEAIATLRLHRDGLKK